MWLSITCPNCGRKRSLNYDGSERAIEFCELAEGGCDNSFGVVVEYKPEVHTYRLEEVPVAELQEKYNQWANIDDNNKAQL